MSNQSNPSRPKNRTSHPDTSPPATPPDDGAFSRWLGSSRYVVLVAVVAVLIVAISLFLQGSWLALNGVWRTWETLLTSGPDSKELTLSFLEFVQLMLEAVVFYLIGVGLYSLFIAPLNLAIALGVENLNDLEDKIISTIIAIMATTFLEHFIRWEKPAETLQFGAAMAAVTASLVFFQRVSHRTTQEQKENDPNTQARAKRDFFQEEHAEHDVRPDEEQGVEQNDDRKGEESKS